MTPPQRTMTPLQRETRRYRMTLALAFLVTVAGAVVAVAGVVGGWPWAVLGVLLCIAPLPLLLHALLRMMNAMGRHHATVAANQAVEAVRALGIAESLAEVRQAVVDVRQEVRPLSRALADLTRDTHAVGQAVAKAENALSLQVQDLRTTSLDPRIRQVIALIEDATGELTRGLDRLGIQVEGLDAERTRRDIHDARRELVGLESVLMREIDALASQIHEASHREQLSAQALTDSTALAQVLELTESGRRAIQAIHTTVERGFLATRVSLEQMPHVVSEYQEIRRQLAPDQIALPGLGGWAITAPVVSAIAGRLLLDDRPLTVLELGSGASTLWTALAISRSGRGRCVSLDHIAEFAQKTRDMLRANGVADHADVLYSPLVAQEVNGSTYEYYDLSVLPDDLAIDVLIIDGPPGIANANTRYPAIPLLYDRLQPGALIVVDDTIRADERKAMASWQGQFPDIVWEADLGKATLLRRG